LLPKEPCGVDCYLLGTSNPELKTEMGLKSASEFKKRGKNVDPEWTTADETLYRTLEPVYPGNYCAISNIMLKSCTKVRR
jgi:hypothetical protein